MTETIETEAPPAPFVPSGRISWDIVRLTDPAREIEYTRAAGQAELRELAKNSPAALAALDASGDQSLFQWTNTVGTGIGSAIVALSAMDSLDRPGVPADIVKLHTALRAVRDDAREG